MNRVLSSKMGRATGAGGEVGKLILPLQGHGQCTKKD